MSRSTRWLFVLACSAFLACGGEPEKYEVPKDIRAEDATFFFMAPLGGEQRLIVHLSRADHCNPSMVPSGTEYVEVGVIFPSETSLAPGTFDVSAGEAGVALLKAGGPCGFTAMSADSGSVTLESVSDDEIRGAFAGVSDSVDLRGSFVAKPCATRPSCG